MFSYYISIYQSVHVSGDYGPIIRRNNCFYAQPTYPHRITSTNFRINTVAFPDDEDIVSRNMQRWIDINIIRKICELILFYLQDYTELHDQQNIKFVLLHLYVPCDVPSSECNRRKYPLLMKGESRWTQNSFT